MASRTGPLADLARSTEAQRAAELRVKQLQCEIAHLSSTNAAKAAKEKLLADAQSRRREVIEAQHEAEKTIGVERAKAEQLQRQYCSEERVRKRAAQDSMVSVFVSRRKEVEDFRRNWEANTRSVVKLSEKVQRELRAAADEERKNRPQRRKEVMESVMKQRKEVHAARQRELMHAKQVLGTLKEEHRQHLAERARDEREGTRARIQRARTAVEDEHRETRVRVVRELQKTRERELRILTAEVRALEQEKAMLGSHSR